MTTPKSKFLRVHEVSIEYVEERRLSNGVWPILYGHDGDAPRRIVDKGTISFLNPSYVIYVETETFPGVTQPVTCIGVADGSSESAVYYVRESVEQVMRQLGEVTE